MNSASRSRGERAPLHPFLADRSAWTLRDIAAKRLAMSGDRPFLTLVEEQKSESFAEFVGRSSALAAFFQACGIAAGESVAILCPPGPAALHGWLAAGLIGAIDVTINPFYRGQVLLQALATTRPRLMLVDAALLPALKELGAEIAFIEHLVVVGTRAAATWPAAMHDYREIVATPCPELPAAGVHPQDASTIMFTSGTTGPSKAALLPNGQACLMAHQVIGNTGLCEDDVYYCVHPLNHIAGKFMGVFATFLVGGRLVLDKKFDASVWLDRVREYGATMSIAHGPMIETIFATPPREVDRDHAMRRLMCCPLPKRIGEKFEARFGLRGVEMWGMTEVGCPLWTALEGPRPRGSCGRLMEEWYELRVADPETDEALPAGETGEILVRPKAPFTTMKKYLGRPEATLEAWRNLWFHTGDAGYRDADGFFYFVDRIRDRIRRRAENISSFDIEDAALKFPGVSEAAAVGVPSGMEGDDDIKLCLVTGPGATVEPEALLRFLLAALPHFMVPRYVEFLESLPRTHTNKIRKRELAATGVTGVTWDRKEAGIRLQDFANPNDKRA